MTVTVTFPVITAISVPSQRSDTRQEVPWSAAVAYWPCVANCPWALPNTWLTTLWDFLCGFFFLALAARAIGAPAVLAAGQLAKLSWSTSTVTLLPFGCLSLNSPPEKRPLACSPPPVELSISTVPWRASTVEPSGMSSPFGNRLKPWCPGNSIRISPDVGAAPTVVSSTGLSVEPVVKVSSELSAWHPGDVQSLASSR